MATKYTPFQMRRMYIIYDLLMWLEALMCGRHQDCEGCAFAPLHRPCLIVETRKAIWKQFKKRHEIPGEDYSRVLCAVKDWEVYK